MYAAPTNNHYSAREAIEICSRAGVGKAHMRLDKMLISGFMAGMFLATACACALVTNSSPWFQTNAPGLIRMIAAMIFPFGLVMIILTGVDLCTGSFLFTTVSVLHRRLSIPKMLIHWTVTFFGNLAGSLFIVGLLTGYGGVFSTSPFSDEAAAFAHTKAYVPQWYQIFLRGIGANWLVCMACYLAMMSRELFSKVIAIWFPVFAFVCLGFDHVVANMFFIPIGIWVGSPGITVGYYIWKSMIPALIGNIVGGGLFCGIVFWYLYLTGENGPVAIDGDYLPADARSIEGESRDESATRSTSVHDKKEATEMV